MGKSGCGRGISVEAGLIGRKRGVLCVRRKRDVVEVVFVLA